ncbi:MAG: hypothetical protein KDE34_21750 [Anaerolineales bacterium]|nr:hypothetical protein [Anaerolineales bacterium]
MTQAYSEGLPILAFASAALLHAWLEEHHASSDGIWVRVYRKSAGIASVTFAELLDEGLCFGWSERLRRRYDAVSYLQKFTPRRSRGTKSARNMARARSLQAEGRLTSAGLAALGWALPEDNDD